MRRPYVVDLPGGTATTSVQLQGNGTIKNIAVSLYGAAAGKLEISTSPTSQIGTAAPTSDVKARLTVGAAGAHINFDVPVQIARKAFELLYFHQTGAGNVGSVSFEV